MDDTEKFINVPYAIDIANVGSSHGQYAFDYSNIENIGFNFSLSGQDFYYDYQLIRQYIDHFNKGAIIFIPVSYFSFGHELFKADFIERNPRYYRFLDRKYIYNFSYGEYILYKLLPILSAKDKIEALIHDEKRINRYEIDENIYSEVELAEIGKSKAEFHIENLSKGDFENNIAYLNKLIKLLKMNNLRPVLITTPFTEYYNRNFSMETYDDFYSIIKNISLNMQMPYLDYSHDTRFERNIELFIDSDHLNKNGRAKFTKIVFSDIEKIISEN